MDEITMSTTDWKDATSYSQGQFGKVEPTAWERQIAGIRVWVSCGHRAYPGEWVISCHHLSLDAKSFGMVEQLHRDQALERALMIFAQKAEEMARKLVDAALIARTAAPLAGLNRPESGYA